MTYRELIATEIMLGNHLKWDFQIINNSPLFYKRFGIKGTRLIVLYSPAISHLYTIVKDTGSIEQIYRNLPNESQDDRNFVDKLVNYEILC